MDRIMVQKALILLFILIIGGYFLFQENVRKIKEKRVTIYVHSAESADESPGDYIVINHQKNEVWFNDTKIATGMDEFIEIVRRGAIVDVLIMENNLEARSVK